MSGIWNAGTNLMLYILNFFYGLTHSYGLSIILLTILVRILLHPLNHKQLVSMQKMQKLQPRLKVLQEKYAGDKEQLNRETMQLYKENNVNPAAGCLPLLVQLPILILLFRVLNNQELLNQTLQLTQEALSFFGIALDQSLYGSMATAFGITGEKIGLVQIANAVMANPGGLLNVGAYLGNLLLVVVIGFLTWFQQQMSAASNPSMQFMNWFMPLFLVFICLSLPGGVLLYWGASSLMGVVQQWRIKVKTTVEMQEKPVLHRERPKRS